LNGNASFFVSPPVAAFGFQSIVFMHDRVEHDTRLHPPFPNFHFSIAKIRQQKMGLRRRKKVWEKNIRQPLSGAG
jgi:hypothetical protein